jgi:hypothetical protein
MCASHWAKQTKEHSESEPHGGVLVTQNFLNVMVQFL